MLIRTIFSTTITSIGIFNTTTSAVITRILASIFSRHTSRITISVIVIVGTPIPIIITVITRGILVIPVATNIAICITLSGADALLIVDRCCVKTFITCNAFIFAMSIIDVLVYSYNS